MENGGEGSNINPENPQIDPPQDSLPTAEAPAPGTSPVVAIAQELSCINCGYNLQGLSPAQFCPECGIAVQRSMNGDLLAFADPAWVRTLRNAITLSLINIALGLLLSILSSILKSPAFAALVSTGNAVLGLAAMWLLTVPEPRELFAPQRGRLRAALRIFALLTFVSQLLLIANLLAPNEALRMASLAIQIVAAPAFWLYFLYLSMLSLRLPDLELARQFKVVMWGYTASIIVMGLGALLALAVGAAAFLLACPAIIALLIFAIWSLVIQIRLRARLVALVESPPPHPASSASRSSRSTQTTEPQVDFDKH